MWSNPQPHGASWKCRMIVATWCSLIDEKVIGWPPHFPRPIDPTEPKTRLLPQVGVSVYSFAKNNSKLKDAFEALWLLLEYRENSTDVPPLTRKIIQRKQTCLLVGLLTISTSRSLHQIYFSVYFDPFEEWTEVLFARRPPVLSCDSSQNVDRIRAF